MIEELESEQLTTHVETEQVEEIPVTQLQHHTEFSDQADTMDVIDMAERPQARRELEFNQLE